MPRVDLPLAHQVLCAIIAFEVEHERGPSLEELEVALDLGDADSTTVGRHRAAVAWLVHSHLVSGGHRFAALSATEAGHEFWAGYCPDSDRERLAGLLAGLWQANRKLSRAERKAQRRARRWEDLAVARRDELRQAQDELADTHDRLEREGAVVDVLRFGGATG